MSNYHTIAESKNFIVLDNYTKYSELHEAPAAYQTEMDLEVEFIQDLVAQGYEYAKHINKPDALLANARNQIERLNNIRFTDSEWTRFLDEYLNKSGETLRDKSRKIHDDYIKDFKFDNGKTTNIYLFDKKDILRNKLQVINQFQQTGDHPNRYDVTILVNGLPLVQIELKKRGVSIQQAFNQVHRYTKESYNADFSLFKFLQIFVISNGTDSRYFANTLDRNMQSYDFTMTWARADNTPINDLKDFTATFFEQRTLLNVLLNYSVFNTNETLLIMRPYQIAATERILWKIASSHNAKNWSKPESGGYIWHTTGSGKTLTSFKAARLATQIDYIHKVFFVVDRKDLDQQTVEEYKKFSPESVLGSNNTAQLKRNIESSENKIIVTTIQKLNLLMKAEKNLKVYSEEVVFIFDEAHRSQFGEAQRNIRSCFKKYYQFGFTGTPIFTKNAVGAETTADVFGPELHNYVITDAIRDNKVLKFNVYYGNVSPRFKNIEGEQDEELLKKAEKEAFIQPARITEISNYILRNFNEKTRRNESGNSGFNAMFAVSSIEAAKLYYNELNRLQEGSKNPLKIATIFSFVENEVQKAKGDIGDESFNAEGLDNTSKEFLVKAIRDYNKMFNSNYSIDNFHSYYENLSDRVRKREVDLVIVVGMFLTGFDAPMLNTLFVDKNLRYHGLLQAYSRTNRIYNANKPFGNIITFRNLEQATIDAITLFGNKNTKNILLEKSFEEYMRGFTDEITGEIKRGYVEITKELKTKFPDHSKIETEQDKRDFVKVFGEYLRSENVLRNYDEFTHLLAMRGIDKNNSEELKEYQKKNFISDEQLVALKKIEVLTERAVQDYTSTYNDIREWVKNQENEKGKNQLEINWGDIVFELKLLDPFEINLDFIFRKIQEYNDSTSTKEELIAEIKRIVRSSLGQRAKENLLIDFINDTDIDAIIETPGVTDAFFAYARERQRSEAMELIQYENLKEVEAKRYIIDSLKSGFASENGTELNKLIPDIGPLHPEYLSKKQGVFRKISSFVQKFKGVGGDI